MREIFGRTSAVSHEKLSRWIADFPTREMRTERLAPLSLTARARAALRSLANFGGQAGFLSGRPARRQWTRADRRTTLDRSDHRRFHAGPAYAIEAKLCSLHIRSINRRLPRTQNCVRQDGEVAKHPQQIYPLPKGWHHVSRPDGVCTSTTPSASFSINIILGPPGTSNWPEQF